MWGAKYVGVDEPVVPGDHESRVVKTRVNESLGTADTRRPSTRWMPARPSGLRGSLQFDDRQMLPPGEALNVQFDSDTATTTDLRLRCSTR